MEAGLNSEVEDFLGWGYVRRVLHGGTGLEDLKDGFRTKLLANHALRAAAQARLADLKLIPMDRCFMSYVWRQLLAETLADLPLQEA